MEDTAIPPIPKEKVLAKVLSALIYSPIKNRSVLNNVEPGITLGSFGVVRVIEPGVWSNATPGGTYGVVPYCNDGVLGLGLDGLASEYAVVPAECLVKLAKTDVTRLTPLYLEFGYLYELAKLMETSARSIIIGCGFAAYVLGMLARKYGSAEILCINDDHNYVKQLRDLGLPFRRSPGDIKERASLVILTEDVGFEWIKLLQDEGRVYMASGVFALNVRFKGNPSKLKLIRPSIFRSSYGMRYINKVSNYVLSSQVGFVDDLSQVASALELFERVVLVFKT